MAVKRCRTVLWATCLCCIGSAWADEVDDAIALLRSGKPDAAYQSLLPLS
ncbi:MAG: hypothetical protein K2P57_05230 [Burkholderiales bacterium]|nr:hypothetical protein [Burkholderiales bacterium]